MASPEGRSRRGDRTSGGQSSFIRVAQTRVAPSTSLSRRDDAASDARSEMSSAPSKREPMRREAWSANDANGDLDEWDYAERGPLAKLKTRQLTEVAREKATMGVYVDDAELGNFSDATPMHLKKLTADPDFVGPESYPRRQRDWVGYYVAFVACFASFVIGVSAISNGKLEYLFHLVESSTGRLCGVDDGVASKPFLWHPHAGERDHGGGAELSVCVTACPTAHSWVCVDADVATAFADAAADADAAAAVYNASAPGAVAPPPSPSPTPPGAACPSGVYLHSLMDFEPVFHACLPKDKEKQTVRGASTTGEEEGDEEGEASSSSSPSSSTPPPIDKHRSAALREVNTPERFIANAVFAEVDNNAWPLVATLVLVIGFAFGLNAILNRDASNYHVAALAGSVLLGSFITALFGLKPFLNMDTLEGVLIDTLDDRLDAARLVRAATPYLAIPAAALVARVASHLAKVEAMDEMVLSSVRRVRRDLFPGLRVDAAAASRGRRASLRRSAADATPPLTSVGVRNGERSMATLLASIVAAELGADCCVLEAGGVRGNATYEASLTFAHLKAELPFENLMAVVPVDGASLSAFVRDSRDRPELQSPRGYAFFLHGDVGLAYCPERKAVTTVRGEPLDPDRLYTVATCVDLGFGSGKNQGSKRERNSQLQRLLSQSFSTRFG